MLLDICFGNRTSWKIFSVFAEAPGKAVTRKNIKILTKIGNKMLTKYLTILEKFGLITCTKLGRSYLYKPNLNNKFTESIIMLIKEEKKETNNLYFKVVIVLREFVYETININLENLKSIYVFGSYVKRTASKGSDLDIAMVVCKQIPQDELMITELIEEIKRRFGIVIQVHYFTEKTFTKKGKIISEITKDGIRIF